MRTVGPRYMAEFRCIGSECEDNCCGGWSVLVDEEHYHAIERVIPAEELARAFKREETTDPQRYALMVLDDNLRCTMLEGDGLCKLHGRFGEEVIPNACAIFPRSAAVVGSGDGRHFELSATLSCPEVARRALLSEDGMDLVELPNDRIVRGLLFKKLHGDESLYHAGFESVRGLLMFVMSQRRISVAGRLFAMGWFAEQTRPFLHEKAERADREVMMKLFGLLRQPEALDRFQEELSAAQLNQPFPASVVLQVMEGAREDPAARLLALIDEALAGDGSEPAAVLAAHRRRMAALPAKSAAVLERALEAYVENALFKDWYTRMPSLSRWVLHLLIRVAILRYLFAGHARVTEDPGAAIVEVVYSLSRTFEHGDRSIAVAVDDLEAQGMVTLGHAVSLLTF